MARAQKPKAAGSQSELKVPGPQPGHVLVLRSVDKDRRSHGGFQWPERGLVEAPDWDPEPICGFGLHGWLRGEGRIDAASFAPSEANSRIWQVVEVDEASVVDLNGKVKFPRGKVLFSGPKGEAVRLISCAYPNAAVIYGTATAGYSGTATAGEFGTATAGDSGTATAGEFGTATAGYSGTATAGEFGTIVLSYWDNANERKRLVVGYTGENGIEAGKAYRLDEDHKFVEVPPKAT